MFERFTDRARRVVVLAQDEARMLNHNYIGTEHILLGLLHEGEGVAAKALESLGIAAKALESLGISLDTVRQQVEEIIGQGQQAPSGHIPFTPRAKKVLELSLRESLQLGHNYIGTEHILLGLIREGDGVAAQVLVRLGADRNRVRQQVIQLLHGHQGKEPVSARSAERELRLLPAVQARLEEVEQRLAAIEQRVGTGPDTSDLDDQIDRVRLERHGAAGAEKYEQAASLRDRENELLASKAVRQEQWAASGPPRTRHCRFWLSDASSSPPRSSGSAPCSVSTASTRRTGQPDDTPERLQVEFDWAQPGDSAHGSSPLLGPSRHRRTRPGHRRRSCLGPPGGRSPARRGSRARPVRTGGRPSRRPE